MWADDLFVPALWERVSWKEGAVKHDWLEATPTAVPGQVLLHQLQPWQCDDAVAGQWALPGLAPCPGRGCRHTHSVPSSLCVGVTPMQTRWELDVSLLWMRHLQVPVGHELEKQAVLGRALGLNGAKVRPGRSSIGASILTCCMSFQG